MKTRMLSAVALVMLMTHFSVQAQTTPRAAATGKPANSQMNGRSPKNSNAMSRATVDGSDGSATNDGASGQSGRPAPLPVVATDKKTIKSSRNMKNKSVNMNRTSASPGKKSADQ
ncbi:hypothetical protein [Spirosoma agri]|uniref:Uncharacterized protein n=1 Tax=Spirosoma agri TaxID=1987381 RepID=A0A6M0IE17_9BACT|nr:hypothetical protein [Spirosoma agri]NEU65962.1 hypothetical protein [Spirosoma agri]